MNINIKESSGMNVESLPFTFGNSIVLVAAVGGILMTISYMVGSVFNANR